ncbi:MAG: hypothetical protein WBJ84_00320 [Bacteroidales bacterium]
MESYSLIIGLVLILLCFIPIWFFQRNQTKGLRKLSKAFKQSLANNNLTVNQPEFWNNSYGIGVDDSQGKLIYIKLENDVTREYVVDLSQIDKCSIQKKTQTSSSGKNSFQTIEGLNLVLTRKNAEKQNDILEFYNVIEDRQLKGEEQIIEKWKKTIDGHIQKGKR